MTAVKRAFRSPTKTERSNTRRREELHEQEDHEEKVQTLIQDFVFAKIYYCMLFVNFAMASFLILL